MGTAAAMAVATRAERRATGRVARRDARDAIGLARLDASAGVLIVAGKDATRDMSNERRTGVRARETLCRFETSSGSELAQSKLAEHSVWQATCGSTGLGKKDKKGGGQKASKPLSNRV